VADPGFAKGGGPWSISIAIIVYHAKWQQIKYDT